MNDFPSLGVWREPLVALAIGGCVIVGLAALAARLARTGTGRRVIWQAAFLGLAGLLIVEMTGLASGVTAYFNRPERPVGWAESSRPTISPHLERQPRNVPVGLEDSAHPTGDASSTTDFDEEPIAEESPTIAWWPGAIWLAGTLVFAARASIARLLLAHYRRKRRLATDDGLLERVRTIAARLGFRRAVRILEADGLVTPAAFGILQPTIVLPARFVSDFTAAQQEAMLAHELAHLTAHDPAWHFFADLVSATLWTHPLVWWARRELRSASETAADEASLVVADGPGVLASCLVQLGTRLAERRSPGWLSMADNGFRSGLGRRVERLLKLEQTVRRPISVIRILVILTLGPTLLLAASALSTAWARTPASEEGDVPVSNAWKRSLAAVVFVTALGTADTAPGEDTPKKPAAQSGGGEKGSTRESKDPDARTRKNLDKDAAKIRAAQEDVAAALDRVLQQIGERDESLSKVDEPDAERVRRELRELNERADQLAEKKAQLEAELQKLRDKQAALQQGKHVVRIKVFRLKHRHPAEISNVITELLPQAAVTGQDGMMGGMMPGGGGLMGMSGGMMSGMPGAGGTGMAMGGMKGGGMGGFSGMGGGMGGPGRPATSWRVAIDPRTGSLIVRGSEDDLKAISDIITALDTPEDKASAKLKNFRTFRLKHSNAAKMAAILQELELKVTVSVLEKGNMLAVSGPEAALKEVGELIDALDVEGKAGRDSVLRPKQ